MVLGDEHSELRRRTAAGAWNIGVSRGTFIRMSLRNVGNADFCGEAFACARYSATLSKCRFFAPLGGGARRAIQKVRTGAGCVPVVGFVYRQRRWKHTFQLSPIPGLEFMHDRGTIGFVVLGSVFLAVTGAEALYADMGHFGRRPPQAAWLFIVLPALVRNYLGQGALFWVTRRRSRIPSICWHRVGAWSRSFFCRPPQR